MSDYTSYVDAAQGLADDMTEIRRDIHAHPELELDNPRTQGQILEALTGLGFDISTGEGCTSVIADIGSDDGPTVLLRADTDALPMTEDTEETFTSNVRMRMSSVRASRSRWSTRVVHPALLTRMSSRPNRSMAAATSARSWASSAMSACT